MSKKDVRVGFEVNDTGTDKAPDFEAKLVWREVPALGVVELEGGMVDFLSHMTDFGRDTASMKAD